MKNPLFYLFIAIILFVMLLVTQGINMGKSSANFCGKIVENGVICTQGESVQCTDKSTTFNTRFIPDNQNLYYALLTLKCPEFGGNAETSNAGDRDSCGHYQQRVSEYMNENQGGKAKIATAMLGSEYSTIFNSNNKAFITSQNNSAQGNNNALDYGNKMRDICDKIIKKGGSQFFDMLQIERLKERPLTQNRSGNFYDLLANFKLEEKTIDRFVFELAESHQPSAKFRADWESKAKTALKKFLERDEYSKVKSKCRAINSNNCDQNYNLPVKTGLYFCNFGKPAKCKNGLGNEFEYSDSYGNKIEHDGIDFSAPAGTPVYAVADGIFTAFSCSSNTDKNCNGGYGNYVKLNHQPTLNIEYITEYGHLSKIENLPEATKVTKGQKIGEVGTTGNSTGNHLHFKVAKTNKSKVNPCDFVKCPELGTNIKE